MAKKDIVTATVQPGREDKFINPPSGLTVVKPGTKGSK